MLKILQRLSVVRRDDDKLILRELPLTNWFFSLVFFLLGLAMTAFNLLTAGIVAALVAFFFAFRSEIQFIIFDRPAGEMMVVRSGVTGRKVMQIIPLAEIKMAYFFVDQRHSVSQAVLVLRGDMFGLSTLSRFGHVWKEQIVITVNLFLKVDPDKLNKADFEPLLRS